MGKSQARRLDQKASNFKKELLKKGSRVITVEEAQRERRIQESIRLKQEAKKEARKLHVLSNILARPMRKIRFFV